MSYVNPLDNFESLLVDLFDFAGDTNHVNAALPSYMLNPANGDLWVGTGNSALDFDYLRDNSDGVIMGQQAHYRTGDYVTGVSHSLPGLVGNQIITVVTMQAGAQDGQHDEQGSASNRSAMADDLALYSPKGFHQGQFGMQVTNQAGQTVTYGLFEVNNNWFFGTDASHPIQGLTLSPDGHSLEDTTNAAFLPTVEHGAAATGDVLAGNIQISLIEYQNVPLLGHVAVASNNVDFHLV